MASQSVALPVDEYERVFAILDACSQADTLDAFKNVLMGALHEHYDCLNTTFFTGPTFVTAFSDPNPLVTGRIMPVIDEYQARWYPKDVFASTQSRAALSKNPAISADKLDGLASDSVSYLQDFLYRKQLHSASVMHLDLANDCHGLVGLFDSEGRQPDRLRFMPWDCCRGSCRTLRNCFPSSLSRRGGSVCRRGRLSWLSSSPMGIPMRRLRRSSTWGSTP